MTKLTRDMFEELNTVVEEMYYDRNIALLPSTYLWFRLAVIAVKALIDIADSLACMASDHN